MSSDLGAALRHGWKTVLDELDGTVWQPLVDGARADLGISDSRTAHHGGHTTVDGVPLAGVAGVLASLPELVRAKRDRGRLSLRDAATQMGISFTALNRWENRVADPNLSHVLAAVRWLDSGTD